MQHKGFSLIELIVVILILGIVSISGAMLIQQGFSASTTSVNLTEQTWHVRLALQRIANELMSLNSIDAANSSSTAIKFQDQNYANVTYTLTGNNITRNGVAIASNITGLIFTYFDNTYATAASISNTYCIGIYAVSYTKQGVFPLQTVVCPRKLS